LSLQVPLQRNLQRSRPRFSLSQRAFFRHRFGPVDPDRRNAAFPDPRRLANWSSRRLGRRRRPL